MDTTEHDAKIAACKAKIDSLRQQMETPYKGFLKSAADFVQDWFEQWTDRAIEGNPETVKRMGSQLQSLRKQLDSLKANTPQLVERYFAREEHWSHLRDPYRKLGKHEVPMQPGTYQLSINPLDEPIRQLFGNLWGVLRDYRLEQNMESSNWRKNPQSDTPPTFAGRYEWTPAMKGTLDGYSGLHDQLWRAVEDWKRAENEKATAEAKDLWKKTKP